MSDARIRRVDIADMSPNEALAHIEAVLKREPDASRKIYSAMVNKVWSLLIERRMDVADWRGLCLGLQWHFAASDKAASERLLGLADILAISPK